MNLHVPPIHRLLPVLHLLSGPADQIGPPPQVVAPPAVLGRNDGPAGEQPVRMQHGQPLAILHVCFASGAVAAVGAMDHEHLKARLLQDIARLIQ